MSARRHKGPAAHSAPLPPPGPGVVPLGARWLLCILAMVALGWVRLAPLEPGTLADRPDLRFVAENGSEYPYLLGYDSYVWLRMARNQLDKGTPCEAIVAGVCRDTLTHAPLGGEMLYADSGHVTALAWLHRLLSLFESAYPLAATALWLQALVAALAALPAFRLGQRIGGTYAGFVAAVLSGTHAAVLVRSLNADNDIWNASLPLAVAACISESFQAPTAARKLAAAALAAMFVWLQAAVWSGWPFVFAVGLAAWIAALGLAALRAAATSRTAAWRDPTCRSLVAPAGAFALLAPLGAAPSAALAWITGAAAATSPTSELGSGIRAVFPNAFFTVQELQWTDLAAVAREMGGAAVLVGTWLGLLVLILAGTPAGRRRTTLVTGSGLWFAFLSTGPVVSDVAVTLAWGIPLVVALGEAAWRGRRPVGELATLGLLAAWLSAGFYQALDVVRFSLLLAPPLGLIAGTSLGWLVELARAEAVRRRWASAAVVGWLATAFVGFACLVPLQQAQHFAATRLPNLNDAWWQAMTELGTQTPPDTIVHTWWHHGYWVEYFARRRVVADGASLRTRIPFWQAQALLADDEATSIGLLRMLSCGSDADPRPEGEFSAWRKLLRHGLDELDAVAAIRAIAPLARGAATSHLAGLGLPASAIEDILLATHCKPDPSVLLLSDQFPMFRDLRLHGRWDVRRATLLPELRQRSEAEALLLLTEQFSYSSAEARRLYDSARELQTAAEEEAFIGAPTLHLASWLPCRASTTDEYECPVGRRGYDAGTVVEAFTFSARDPARGTLRLRRESGASETVRPRSLLLARPQELLETRAELQADDAYAVLVDIAGKRVLIGPPYLVRSTLIQLVYLDGRYLTHFRQRDEQRTASERVTAWDILWNGP